MLGTREQAPRNRLTRPLIWESLIGATHHTKEDRWKPSPSESVLEVSPIAFGTWQLAEAMTEYLNLAA